MYYGPQESDNLKTHHDIYFTVPLKNNLRFFDKTAFNLFFYPANVVVYLVLRE